jgi:hypothetical protein
MRPAALLDGNAKPWLHDIVVKASQYSKRHGKRRMIGLGSSGANMAERLASFDPKQEALTGQRT